MRMPKPNFFVSKNSFRSWIRKLFERKASKSHKGDTYRQLSLEHLEDRLAPATLTNTSATTITILLDAATENLTVSQAGASGTINLATSTAFTNNLVPATQFAAGVLTPTAGTTTIVIVDQNGSTGSTVTFGATANTLTQTFNVNLNANTTTSTGNLNFAAGVKNFGAGLTANLGSATTTNSITDAAGSTINVTGNLAFTNTKADITLDDSVVNVTGTTNFTALTNITANNGANDFTGVVTLNSTGAGNIDVDDVDDIVLGAVTLTTGTNASIAAGQGGVNGGITGSGAISAPGTAATTAAVVLTNFSSGDINLSGNITVGFGNLAANSGFLTVQNFSGGSVTLSGAVVVRGAAASIGSTTLRTVLGLANTITATNAANDFQGPLTVDHGGAGAATISDSNILTMGGFSFLNGPATLTAATDINSAVGASIELASGTTAYTFRSTAGKIDFTTNPFDVNPFGGVGGIGLEVTGTAAANTISITDPNDLRLGAVNAGATGTGVGPITIGVGQAGGAIVRQLTQVTVGVTPPIINTDGPVTINAGVATTTPDKVDIILGNANDIAGTVTIAAPAISATSNGVVRDLTLRNINAAAAIPTFTGGVAFVNTAGGGTTSGGTPDVVTTTNAHGLVSGDLVTISGVTTDTNANGTWRVTVTGDKTFQLDGSTGTAAGTTATYTARDLRNVSFTFNNATSATLFTALPSINLGGSLSLTSPSGIGQAASTTIRTDQFSFGTNTFSVTGTGGIALANAGNAIGGTTDIPVNGIVAANVADNAATINIVNARLSGAVTGATAAAPIVITATAHGLVPGSRVVISGSDNLAANGVWTIGPGGFTANTFSLLGSNGTGFTAGTTGTWEAGVGLALDDVSVGKTGTGTGLLTLSASGDIFQNAGFTIKSGGAANVTMSLVGRNSGSIEIGNINNSIAGVVTLAAGAADAVLDLQFRNASTAAVLPTLTNISLTGTAAATITSSTAANPVVVTTAAAHGLVSGNFVIISGVTGAPLVNGTFTVTVLSATTFSIPVNSTVAGTGGSFLRPDIRDLALVLDKASIAALPAITVGNSMIVIAGDATAESSITGTNALLAGGLNFGGIFVNAEGNLTLSGAITGGNFSAGVAGGDVDLSSDRGNVTLGPGAITSDRDVIINAFNTDNDAGVVTISGNISAGDDVFITAASTGTVTNTGTITTTSTTTGDLNITGNTGVNVNGALTGNAGGINITSNNGNIIISAAITDLNGFVDIEALNVPNDPNAVQVQINAAIQAQGLFVQAGDNGFAGVTRGIISNSAAGVITTRHQGVELDGLSGVTINGVINAGITGAITGLTNPAAAQVVVTSAAHNLATGNQIVISGVTPDNIGVNGTRTVTVIDANTFTIGVLGNGVPADLGTTGTWVTSGNATIETGLAAGNGSVSINNVINANFGTANTLNIIARGANQSVSNTTAGKINTGGGAWFIQGEGGSGVNGVTLIAPSTGSVITTGTGAGTITTVNGDINLSGSIAASAIRGNLTISAGGLGKFINSATGTITTGAATAGLTVSITGNSGVTIGGVLTIGISNTISGATNANPTAITTPSTTGLLTNDRVFIGGVLGNVRANVANLAATVINATSFSVPVNTTGEAAYISGGTWQSGANLTIAGGAGATNNTGVAINAIITGNGTVTINDTATDGDILVAAAVTGRSITGNASGAQGSFRNTATLTGTPGMGGFISLTGRDGVIVDAALSADTGASTITTNTGAGNINLNVAVSTLGNLTISANSATANLGNVNGSQNVTVAAGHILTILGNNSINLTGAISVTPRSGAVTATAAAGGTLAPQIIITSAAHGLANGAQVTINGVLGTVAANGTRTITVIDADRFLLQGSAFDAAFTSGGTWTAIGTLNITAANSAVLPGVITVGGVVNPAFTSGTTTVIMNGVQGVFSATNTNNDFQGVVTLNDTSTTGSDFSLFDANTLQFGGASTVRGNLGVTVAGSTSTTIFAISEATGASITTGGGGVTSTATFTVNGSNAKDDIVLSGNNVFSGGALDSLNMSVAGAANNITLNQTGGVVGRLGNVSLGNTTSNTGTLLITVNNGGVSELSTANGIRTAGPVNLTSVGVTATNDFQLAGAPNIIANTVTFLQTTPSKIRDLQLRNTSTAAAANLRIGTTGAITSTNGANPDQITTTSPHGLVTGDTVTIAGVVTDTAANVSTPTTVTVTGANTFTIPVAGTAAGTGGAFTSFTGNRVLNPVVATARNVSFIFDGGATGTALPVGAGSPFGAATPPTLPAMNITGVLVVKAAGGTGFTQATGTVINTVGDGIVGTAKNIFETFDGAAINLSSNGTLFNSFPDTIELIQDGAGNNAISLRNSATTNLGNVLFGTTIRGLPSTPTTTPAGTLTIVSQGGINQAGATAPIITSGVVLLTIDTGANVDFDLSTQPNNLSNAGNKISFTNNAGLNDFKLRNIAANANLIDLSALNFGNGSLDDVSIIFNNAALPTALDPGTGLVNVLITGNLDLEVAGAITQGTGTKIQVGGAALSVNTFRTFGNFGINLGNTGNLFGSSTLNLITGGTGAANITVLNASPGAGLTFDDVIFGDLTGSATGSGNLVMTANGSIIQLPGTPPILTSGTGTFTIDQVVGASFVLSRDNVFGGGITLNLTNNASLGGGDLIIVNGGQSGTITIPNIVALVGGTATGGRLDDLILDFLNLGLDAIAGLTTGTGVNAILPAIDITGNLILRVAGPINTGTSVTKTSLVTGANGPDEFTVRGNFLINVNAAGNLLSQTVVLSNPQGDGTANVAVRSDNANGINLAASSLGHGTLFVQAGSTSTTANITQSGAITQANGAGLATFQAGNAATNIDLSNAGNSFSGGVTLTGPTATALNVNFRNTHPLAQVPTVSGLTLSNNDNLTVFLDNAGASLPGLTVNNLTVTARGILQSDTTTAAGALVTGGQAIFTANAAGLGFPINLSNPNNNFASTTGNGVQVVTQGPNPVSIQDSSAVNFIGASKIGSGDFIVLTNNGDITQNAGSSIVQSLVGSVNFDAGTGKIDLFQPGNDFLGPVTLVGGSTGTSVRIQTTNNLVLGTTIVGDGADFSATAGGSIVQAPGQQVLDSTVSTNTDTLVAGGDIILGNAVNEFSSHLAITAGGNVVIVDSDSSFGGVDLAASSIGGNLTVRTTENKAGNITDSGVVTVGGLATFEASSGGTIVLDGGVLTAPGNNFNSISLKTTNAAASVKDSSGLDVTRIDIGSGALSLVANGSITQGFFATPTSIVSGAATLDAGAGNTVLLGSATNNIVAATSGNPNITLNSSSGNVTITNLDDIIFTTGSGFRTSSVLSLNAGGTLTVPAGLNIGSLSSLSVFTSVSGNITANAGSISLTGDVDIPTTTGTTIRSAGDVIFVGGTITAEGALTFAPGPFNSVRLDGGTWIQGANNLTVQGGGSLVIGNGVALADLQLTTGDVTTTDNDPATFDGSIFVQNNGTFQITGAGGNTVDVFNGTGTINFGDGSAFEVGLGAANDQLLVHGSGNVVITEDGPNRGAQLVQNSAISTVAAGAVLRTAPGTSSLIVDAVNPALTGHFGNTINNDDVPVSFFSGLDILAPTYAADRTSLSLVQDVSAAVVPGGTSFVVVQGDSDRVSVSAPGVASGSPATGLARVTDKDGRLYVVVRGLTNANAALTLTITTTRSAGGDGFADIGGIAVNGIGATGRATINASTSNVDGDIFVNGRIAALNIRNMINGTIESPFQSSSTTTATTITGTEFNNVNIDLLDRLSALTLRSYNGGTITADHFGTIRTTGNAAAGNTGDFIGELINNGTGAAGLTTMSVAGGLNNSLLNISGTIGSVTARSTSSTQIGLDPGPNRLNGGLLGNVTTLNLGTVNSTSVHAETATARVTTITARSWLGGSIHANSIGTITTTGESAVGNAGDFSPTELIVRGNNGGTARTALGTLRVAGSIDGSRLEFLNGNVSTITVGRQLGNTGGVTLFLTSTANPSATQQGSGTITTLQAAQMNFANIDAKSITNLRLVGNAAAGMFGNTLLGGILLHGSGVTGNALGTLTATGALVSTPITVENGNVGTISVTQSLSGSNILIGAGTLNSISAGVWTNSDLTARSITTLNVRGLAQTAPASFLVVGNMTASSINTYITSGQTAGGTIGTMTVTGNLDLGISDFINAEEGITRSLTVRRRLSGGVFNVDAGRIVALTAGSIDSVNLGAETIGTLRTTGFTATDNLVGPLFTRGDISTSNIVVNGQTTTGAIVGVGTISVAGDINSSTSIDAFQGITNLTVSGIINGASIIAPFGPITTLTSRGIASGTIFAESITTLRTTKATSVFDQVAPRFQDGDIVATSITVTGAGTGTLTGVGIGTLSVAGDFISNTLNVVNRINTFTVTQTVDVNTEAFVGGGITTLTVGHWNSTDLAARFLSTFRVNGVSALGLTGDVENSTFTITGNTGGTTNIGLGTFAATGTVNNSTFNINGGRGGVLGGNVTSFSSGRFLDSNLFLGFHAGRANDLFSASAPTSAFAATFTLTTFRTSATFNSTNVENSASFSGSNVVASRLGTVTLTSIDNRPTAIDGVTFGVGFGTTQGRLIITSVSATVARPIGQQTGTPVNAGSKMFYDVP